MKKIYARKDGGLIGDLCRFVSGKLWGWDSFGRVRTDRSINTILLLVIAIGVWFH